MNTPTMNTTYAALITGAAIAVALATGYGLSTVTASQTTTATTMENAPTTQTQGMTYLADVSSSTPVPLPPLPSELADLEPDANFPLNGDGSLRITPSLRNLFDFYLSNLDNEPLAQVLQRIRDLLGTRLDDPAYSQALDLLERYVGYRLALEELSQTLPSGMSRQGLDALTLRNRQSALEALRQASFSGEEVDAFFGLEQTQDEYLLARLAIEQDAALGEDARQQALDALEHSLPAPLRSLRERVTVNARVYQQSVTMKAEGASEAELFRMRAEALGESAATNLAELDEQQRRWQDRLTRYALERDRIRQAGLSPEDQQSAIETLRNRMFEGPERLRVTALDEL